METIKGYVDHIIFQNSDNGYTVLELVADEDSVVLVGMLRGVTQGDCIEGEFRGSPGLRKPVQGDTLPCRDAGGRSGNGALSGVRGNQGRGSGAGSQNREEVWQGHLPDHGGRTGAVD